MMPPLDEFGQPMLVPQWLVCEEGTRWITAARRLLPSLMPPGDAVRVLAVDRRQVMQQLTSAAPTCLLWEIDPDRLVAGFEAIVQIRSQPLPVVHLVAADGLSDDELLALLELGIGGWVRYPEDLSKLCPLFAATFARWTRCLD